MLAADAIGVDVKRVTWRMLVASAILQNLLDRRLLPGAPAELEELHRV